MWLSAATNNVQSVEHFLIGLAEICALIVEYFLMRLAEICVLFAATDCWVFCHETSWNLGPVCLQMIKKVALHIFKMFIPADVSCVHESVFEVDCKN